MSAKCLFKQVIPCQITSDIITVLHIVIAKSTVVRVTQQVACRNLQVNGHKISPPAKAERTAVTDPFYRKLMHKVRGTLTLQGPKGL